MSDNYKHSQITEQIIKAYYKVYNKLGVGFLEKVYENAMMIELKKLNLNCESQAQIKVYYNDQCIGEYYADIIVEGKVIVELKAVKEVQKIHEVQLVNYLKATQIEVGLLLNFGRNPRQIRKVLD
jgi:GxxExxY protein